MSPLESAAAVDPLSAAKPAIDSASPGSRSAAMEPSSSLPPTHTQRRWRRGTGCEADGNGNADSAGCSASPSFAFCWRPEGGDPPSAGALLTAVRGASDRARPPVSRYNVGAVGVGLSGRVYCGLNLEFLGAPMSSTVHAEQFLCATMAIHGERGLVDLAVTAPPCGHCRQFLMELPDAKAVRVHIHRLSKVDRHDDAAALVRHRTEAEALRLTLGDLLPHAFGPADLLPSPAYFLTHADEALRLELEEQSKEVERIAAEADILTADRDNAGMAVGEALGRVAVLARRAAYVPYSNCGAGVALLGRSGNRHRVAWGYSVECAAYNPTLPPLQFALIHWVQGGGGDYTDITRAVVAEPSTDGVTYSRITNDTLAAITRGGCETSIIGAGG